MGMTMTQKILAAAAGLDHVEAGQLIEANLDLVLGNDITSPVAIHEIEKLKDDSVFDKDKIALVMDHFIPNKDIKSAEHCKCVREFACRHEITNYFDVGEMGIEHALLPEKGLTVAGDVIIGADSHTCTYGALGAFSTGVGSTDMAAGMATGKAWFKVPSAIRFNLIGKPSKWVSGKDVIRKLVILAREAGYRLEQEDVEKNLFVPDDFFKGSLEEFWKRVPGLDADFEARRRILEKENKHWRFVAKLENGKASVGLQEVGANHPFYGLEGSNNIILLTTERYREYPMMIQGYGAGAGVTAAGVFADIMSIANV